ncbi:uncharacterized protein VTP21DRAFT_8909 [Calcarisporiella thermophila]|uniref:uncharacterized protein n=1 Tax=Calcarisporiella thermophila TaxID=911321 RepID=UPI0037422B04
MPTALLLRDPRPNDPYAHFLTQYGYDPHFAPVMQTVFYHGPIRQKFHQRPEEWGLGGVVITSQRGVDALKEVWNAMDEDLKNAWRSLPLFAVGPSTAAASQKLLSWPAQSSHAGNAEQLSSHIISYFSVSRTSRSSPTLLLFLCGDKRRDVLPTRLRDAGLHLEELCVYETRPAPLNLGAFSPPDWLLFFSPSGVDYSLASLKDHFGPEWWQRCKIATIGPTTAAHPALANRRCAIASKPEAEEVVKVMVAFEKDNSPCL